MNGEHLVQDTPVHDRTASRESWTWTWSGKNAFDLLSASVLVLLCLPAMLLVTIAVWLSSPGPILFCQPRRGLNGAVIPVLKFRTLRAECEDRLGKCQVADDDPRLTTIGAILRRTSLDELPQLFNVLRGDMSLVGPRPHALGMLVEGRLNADIIPAYLQRYTVRPGITGLAQVKGCRGRVDTAEQLQHRLSYDLHYIQHRSLALDLRILFLTAMQIVVMKKTG
jgi:polysaccharide biosynthesis protein PslA